MIALKPPRDGASPANKRGEKRPAGHDAAMSSSSWQTSTGSSAGDDKELVGVSPIMQELRRALRKVAQSDAPVLLNGESGTGKELAALFIHRLSSRRDRPFVTINCGALSPTLIQSELFGHEKGSFTGAHKRHIGRLEAANGGTCLLDEIADLPLELQVNMLRFLQENALERIGSTEPIYLDVRVIAASHVDLESAVEENRFREDLLYRLNVLRLTLPPLRDRGPDVELLAKHFLVKFSPERTARIRGFSQEALQLICHYHWPGNVRELMNLVRRATVMSDGGLITPRDLGLDRRSLERKGISLKEARCRAEKNALRSALGRSRNNVSRAAADLSISRGSLYRLLRKHNLLP